MSVNKTPALLSLPTPTELQLRRAEVIANAPEFRARVAQALAARFPEDPAAPTPMVEKQIFGGFYSHADKGLLAELQHADWRRRQEIVSTLSDARLRQLGRRLVAFYARELLSPAEQEQYKAWLRERWFIPVTSDAEWMTTAKAREALDDLRADQGFDAELLGEVETYLQCFDIPSR